MNNGADFFDLPDMNHRKNKDVFTGKFELSPYFVLGILAKIPIKMITINSTPDNLCHTGATCFHF